MRVVVYSHRLEVGGSQTNAADLAASVRDLGHDVVVFGVDGPAAELVRSRGLRLVLAPDGQRHPAPRSVWALCQLARNEQADIVHAYEWPACLDAYYGPHLLQNLPLVFTVLSMTVPRWLPGQPPLLTGTPELVRVLKEQRSGPVFLGEPPVDAESDFPELDPSGFLEEHRLGGSRLNLVIVSRLVESMKLEGIHRSIDAVAVLARRHPVRLVIVGGGTAYEDVRIHAKKVNDDIGDTAVVLTGPMANPRPAYAAADVVLGMGSSALRAMSFAKPLIVLGENGFSAPFTPGTSCGFLDRGFYGLGDGTATPEGLADQIARLVSDPEQMRQLGELGRQTVLERFSLKRAAHQLVEIYEQTIAERPSRTRELVGAVRPSAHLAFSELVPVPAKRRIISMLPHRLRPSPQPWDAAP